MLAAAGGFCELDRQPQVSEGLLLGARIRGRQAEHRLDPGPADGDLAVRTARESGGAVYAVAEDEVGENMSLLAETAGVFGETAASEVKPYRK